MKAVSRQQDLRLWAAIALAPLAWFLDLCVSLAVVPDAHMAGRQGTLWAIQGGALLIPVITGLVGWRELGALRDRDPADVAVQRARFLAIAAVALSALAIALILATALATLLLLPGAEP